MKMHKTILTMLAATLAVIGTTATVVHGDGPDVDAAGIVEQLKAAENPGVAFAELSPVEQAAVIEFQTPVRYEEGLVTYEVLDVVGNDLVAYDNDDDFEHCRPQIFYRAAYGATGATLWRYISDTYFCYDGTQHTRDPNFGTRGETFLFWEFVGDTNTSESGGAGDWAHTDYASGHFKLCVSVGPIEISCPFHDYPWIRKHQYGNGSYTATGGG